MLKAQLSVASSKAVTVEWKVENRETDIVTKSYLRINRKKATDYKLSSQRLLELLRSQKLGNNCLYHFYRPVYFSQFPVIRECAGG